MLELTWTSNNVPEAFAVASSADGSKLVAVVNGGGIYTRQTTPAPALSIVPSGGSLTLSWTVPSIDLVLQGNADLNTNNWMGMTNKPTLNLTNLKYEVSLPLSVGSRFFRLSH